MRTRIATHLRRWADQLHRPQPDGPAGVQVRPHLPTGGVLVSVHRGDQVVALAVLTDAEWRTLRIAGDAAAAAAREP